MGKGSYPGGGTIIGPEDISWYGNSGIDGGRHPDARNVNRRQAHPLTADAERRIGNLRIDVAGLERQLSRLDQERQSIAESFKRSRDELAGLLAHHGLPLDCRRTPPS